MVRSVELCMVVAFAVAACGPSTPSSGQDAGPGSGVLDGSALADSDSDDDGGANGADRTVPDGAATASGSDAAPDGTREAAIPAPTSDVCSGPDMVGNDAAHAAAYALGTDFQACLQSPGDVDFYQFTTPANPSGGYVVVTLTNGGPASLNSTVWAGGDTTELYSLYGTGGGPTSYWFAAAPSTTFHIEVDPPQFSNWGMSAYTLNATFTAVNDIYEPNQSKSAATPLTVSSAVQAFMFAGYSSSQFSGSEWWDFYKVTLGNGTATVKITNVPTDFAVDCYLYDSTNNANTIQGYGYAQTPGTIMFATNSPVTAGDYFVQVEPTSFAPRAYGSGTTPAKYATQPYTLVVSQ